MSRRVLIVVRRLERSTPEGADALGIASTLQELGFGVGWVAESFGPDLGFTPKTSQLPPKAGKNDLVVLCDKWATQWDWEPGIQPISRTHGPLAAVPLFTHSETLLWRQRRTPEAHGLRILCAVDRVDEPSVAAIIRVARQLDQRCGSFLFDLVPYPATLPAEQTALIMDQFESLSGKLRFWGSSSQAARAKLLSQADVLYAPVPSAHVFMPLIEAQAAGVPVVAATGGTFADTLGPDQLIASPSNDAEADARFFARLIYDAAFAPLIRAKAVNQGYRNFLTRFSPDAVAESFMAACLDHPFFAGEAST